MINGVLDNGQWCEDKEVVMDNVRDFFKARFDKSEEIPVRMDVSFSSIIDDDNSMLVGIFSKEEVKSTVWSCDSSKSFGPNDFNFDFIKFGWMSLKEVILSAVNVFMVIGRWPRGSNASFICLLLKVDITQQLGDFRPISLVDCLYKIISKLLSIRLKKVLSKVIDHRLFLKHSQLFLKEGGY